MKEYDQRNCVGGMSMECVHCFRKVEENFLVCPYCTQPINKFNSGSAINAGKNNINIGLGINSKQDIYIENLNVPEEDNELIVEYSDRIYRRVLGGVTGFKRRFDIVGVLSVISAIITITDFFITKSDRAVFFMVITLGMGYYAYDSLIKYKELLRDSIVYRENRPVLVEEEGEVYKVKKYGICPICQGRVYIYNDERFKKRLGKCVNNDDHLYTYDHTIDMGVPFVYFDVHHSK